MTVKYAPRVYAPFYAMPASEREGGFVLASYERMKRSSAYPGYFTVNLSMDTAFALAAKSSHPAGVKLAVMKQVANTGSVTLAQMNIFLSWAARRAQSR